MSGSHLADRQRPGPLQRLLGRRPGTAVVLAATTVVVGLGLVAAAVRPAWQIRYRTFDLPRPTPRFTPPPAPSFTPVAAPPPPSGGGGTAAAVLLGILIALGVAVLALLGLLLVRWLRRRLREATVEDDLESREVNPQLPVLRRGVEEAERRLLRGGDPTDAILTAWLALEEAAADSGVPRDPTETPTEFTLAVVARTGIAPSPVHELLGLYHRARFTSAGSPPEDLAAARRCVAALASAWQAFDLDADLPDRGGRR